MPRPFCGKTPWRPPSRFDEPGPRTGILEALGATGQRGRSTGSVRYARRLVPAIGQACCRIRALPAAGAAWVAQGGAGYSSPKERSKSPGGLEKKLPETLGALLIPEEVRGRKVRLMFQDEARFGRMVRIRRCWSPAPARPSVPNGYEREFVYVYGAVSPLQGEMDWMICREMNTERMSSFLQQVSAAHPEDFILMVLDGASSHKAKQLLRPENIRLVALPPYSPELNPQEHVWDELREKEFPNRVFNELCAVVRQLEQGLPRMTGDRAGLRSLTAWPWIISLNLNAN